MASCRDCRFWWTTAMCGVGTYAREGRTNPWWRTVPPGTLPVFREESGEDVCLGCGGVLVVTGERQAWKECGECGFGWGMVLPRKEWSYKRTDPDGATRFRRLPDRFLLLVASSEEAL